MRKNKSALPEVNPKGLKICADRANDQARRQYTTLADNSKDFQTYRLAVRRACADAYILFKDFPRNGCLRCLGTDRGGVQ